MRHQLQSLHQDAISWKSQRIWQTAVNPDREADATACIVAMLMAIPNDVKKNSYTKIVCRSIYDFVKIREKQNHEQLLPTLKEADLKSYLKDALKERTKSREKAKTKAREDAAHLEGEAIGLSENFKGNLKDAYTYGIYEQDNCYFVRSSKNTWPQVSSFVMEVKYLIKESATVAYRIITLSNAFGKKQTITFNTDDLTSVGAFKKVINRLSGFNFSGADADLGKINEYLQRNEQWAAQLNTLGYYTKHKFWAWGNGILDMSGDEIEYIQADEFGMVTTKTNNTFFIPSANGHSEMSDEMDVSPERKFIHTDRNINFTKWAQLHHDVHGNNAIIGQLWFCAALFRDVIFGNPSIARMPMLFLYGQPGTGKGVFATGLLSLLGYPQSSIMLESGGSTQKGILRRFAQIKNGIVWLDEFKNTIHKSLIGTIKQLYDGQSYTRAVKSNDNRTENSPISCSAIVSGQDMPIIEAALLERHVLLQFEPQQSRTETAMQLYSQLSSLEAHGLSSVTNDVLRNRKQFAEYFFMIFKNCEKEMRQELSHANVSDRYIMNFAILLAVHDTLCDFLRFPFARIDAKKLLTRSAITQCNLTRSNNDLAKFWQVVEYLQASGLILHDLDFKLQDKYILLSMKKVHPLYLKEVRSRGDSFGLEKAVLENYLRADKSTWLDYKKARFTNSMNYVHIFDYHELVRKYNVNLNPMSIDHSVPENVEDLLRPDNEIFGDDSPI